MVKPRVHYSVFSLELGYRRQVLRKNKTKQKHRDMVDAHRNRCVNRYTVQLFIFFFQSVTVMVVGHFSHKGQNEALSLWRNTPYFLILKQRK